MAEISISERAVPALKDVMERTGDSESSLRLYVDHQCHCGGLKYGMGLGAPLEDDVTLDVSGIHLSLAPDVAQQPGRAEIDFIESALQSGFTLTNSEHSCGGMMHGA
jgi:Fe-S cluster assembly iron-binding protein IscA